MQEFENAQFRAAIEKALAEASEEARLRDKLIVGEWRDPEASLVEGSRQTSSILRERARTLIKHGEANADEFKRWL